MTYGVRKVFDSNKKMCQEGIRQFSGSVKGVSDGVRKVSDGISNISD